MKKAICILILSAFMAVPAVADLVVPYDMTEAVFNFTKSSKQLLVTESTGSNLLVTLEDELVIGPAKDSAKIVGGDNFDLVVDLTMKAEFGANNWSAAGTLKFTDTDTASYAVEADFHSTLVEIDNEGYLRIEGTLSDTTSNTSILVNRGDPWEYVGNAEGAIAGDADGKPNQITVYNPGSYDGGTLLTIKFAAAGYDLDTLFSDDREDWYPGEVKGQIVPVPAAVLLGFLGLSAAGLKLRKFA